MKNENFRSIAFLLILLLMAAVLLPACGPGKSRGEWHDEDGYRWAELYPSGKQQAGFVELAPKQTGITFANDLTNEQIKENRNLLNGSGVAVGDVDGDGLADIYFCRLNGANVLYKNLGDWKFEDITEQAGVACPDRYSTGATFVDIDGDGDLDLIVLTLGGPHTLFLNDGSGGFTEAPDAGGIARKTGATTAAFADIDGDGDLDLYIANYKALRMEDIYTYMELSFENIVVEENGTYKIAPQYQDDYELEIRGTNILWLEKGELDHLYVNDGKGNFTPVSFTDGTFLDEDGRPAQEMYDWGLSVRMQDIDGDGSPDIYVANDFDSPDRIWLNDGNGRFRALSRLAMRNSSHSSMSVDFSDINRNGLLDFFVPDMLSMEHQRRQTQQNTRAPVPLPIGVIDNRPQFMKNTLFLNRGDGTYAEIGQYSGVAASDWSWSVVFLDVDLDGFEDMLITTGNLFDVQDRDATREIFKRIGMGRERHAERLLSYPPLHLRNVAFRNRGDLHFDETGEAWGFASVDVTHGIALGDFDNDGDLDVVTNRLHAPAGVYRNESAAPRLAVRLRGLAPNTQGIGAKIVVEGGPVPQSKEAISGGMYLSGSDPQYVFAAGERRAGFRIEVQWRSGAVSVIDSAMANRLYEIWESGASLREVPAAPADTVSPYFVDVSAMLSHVHHETPFNDLALQFLLPNRLSQTGPGVSWYDVDGDGLDELFISSGRGGELGYFRNNGGRLQRGRDAVLAAPSSHEQAGVVGFTRQPGVRSLAVAYSNYESPELDSSLVRIYDYGAGGFRLAQELRVGPASIGALAVADYDGDGALDLFVGGRVQRGRWPEPVSSYLYRNVGGRLELDAANSASLANVGLVTGAVFGDVTGDAAVDLVLATEWGPVRVLVNEDGRFVDATSRLGLSGQTGWWNGVALGDFDGDGRLDIAATNWGLNSKYTMYQEGGPLRVYYSDFDRDGQLDVIEAYTDPATGEIVPERDFRTVAAALPYVGIRILTDTKYSTMNVQSVIGSQFSDAREVQATTLAHTVFLNRGEHFDAVALPAEAQFAPAFYAGVADFDGDGHDDLFLSQNFFATQQMTPRLDGGRGLWLRGHGDGSFSAVPGQESGVRVYGEQRGAGLSDFDGDGRVDVVVTQNTAPTQLYRNVGGRPGLRVRLVGPAGNPSGVGAVVWLAYGEGRGPSRSISSGSGYWSQDGLAPLLGRREGAQQVVVRWPGGEETRQPIEDGDIEILVRYEEQKDVESSAGPVD